MIRLLVTAEGYTELAFVKNILAPHLSSFGIFADARCVLTSKDKPLSKEHRGGGNSYDKAKKDILTWMKEDNHTNCRFTTMFDLYALPTDFPDYERASRQLDPYKKVEILEEAMSSDIDDWRFIPYIQLHEFEALVLVDPQKLDLDYLEHQNAINRLISSVGNTPPELVNDSPETAPSKRIVNEIPEYNKVSSGICVTKEIGIQKLRDKCPHFNTWLCRLEQLSC